MGTGKRRITLLIAACGLLLVPTPASGATVIGQSSAGGMSCGADLTVTQLADTAPELTYEVPPPGGVLTRWSYFAAGGADEVKFVLLRREAAGGLSVVFANTRTMTPGRVNTFPIQTRAQEGDLIGIHVGPAGTSCVLSVPFPGNIIVGCQLCDPATGTSFATDYFQQDVLLNVAAAMEPDCDSDGAGDESQDSNIASCPPAPQVAITKAPKDKVKTKRKRLKVIFRFESNEQGSTFDCVLDEKREFKTCTSPLSVRVKPGKHTFSVSATDPGGNTGAPVSDTWKVKRKKKD